MEECDDHPDNPKVASCPTCQKLYMARYYVANKERIDARMLAWRAAHPTYHREWHAAHPDWRKRRSAK